MSCSVCGGSFCYPDNWNKEFKGWMMTSSQLDMQSCLCPKCSRSLRRKWENFAYVCIRMQMCQENLTKKSPHHLILCRQVSIDCCVVI